MVSVLSTSLIMTRLSDTSLAILITSKGNNTINGIWKGAYAMDYSIVWVRGHVEVYDWAGRFCFSADSEREAREELEGAA